MNLRQIKRNIPFAATALVCLLLYAAAGAKFKDEGFLSLRVFISFFFFFFFLAIAAIFIIFVFFSGGVCLSVGGVVGLLCLSVFFPRTRVWASPPSA